MFSPHSVMIRSPAGAHVALSSVLQEIRENAATAAARKGLSFILNAIGYRRKDSNFVGEICTIIVIFAKIPI